MNLWKWNVWKWNRGIAPVEVECVEVELVECVKWNCGNETLTVCTQFTCKSIGQPSSQYFRQAEEHPYQSSSHAKIATAKHLTFSRTPNRANVYAAFSHPSAIKTSIVPSR